MRMEPFFGSVFWGPTWIESCVMDAGSARVTGGTLMKIRCASCAPAARIQAPRARSIATTVPAVNLSPMDAIRLRSRVSFSKRQELTYQEGAVAVTAVNLIARGLERSRQCRRCASHHRWQAAPLVRH
jgi:hypothetical protein